MSETLRVAILEPPEATDVARVYHHVSAMRDVLYDAEQASWIEVMTDATHDVAAEKRMPVHVRRFPLLPWKPIGTKRGRNDLFEADVILTANATDELVGIIGAALQNNFNKRCMLACNTVEDRDALLGIAREYQMPVLNLTEASEHITLRPRMFTVLRNQRDQLMNVLRYCFDMDSAPVRHVDPLEYFKVRAVDRV